MAQTRSPTANTGSWHDPANAYADDSAYAYCGNGEGGLTHDFSAYGFSAVGIINAVRVDIKGYTGDSSKHSINVYVWDGSNWHSVGVITSTSECNAHQFDASSYIDTPAKLNAIKVRIESVGLAAGASGNRYVRACWIPVYADWTEAINKSSDVSLPLGWTPAKELQADISSEHNHPLGWTPDKELDAALSSAKDYPLGWSPESALDVEKSSEKSWPLGWTPGKQLDAALTSQKSYPLAWTPQFALQAAISSQKDYSLVWSSDKALDAALSSQQSYSPGWFSDSSVAVGAGEQGVPKLSEVTWPLGWTSYSSKGIIVWKGLTDTLFAAQKKPYRLPYVEAKVYDYEAGIKRLSWTRVYEGSEPDNHHGIAFDGQGSMHRIRAAADNKLYHQKITSPGPSSDYSQWTQIATDCAGPCAIAASGAKVYIFYRTTTNVLWKYYSHDYGQSWDDAQLADYTDVLSLAACWRGTGDIVVCFALKASQLNGIVLDTSDQTTTPHTWSDANHPLLDTYGIGVTFNASTPAIEIVLAGKESDSPYNHYDLFRTRLSSTYNFSPLDSFLMSPDGEDITYEYPDCHLPTAPKDYETNRIVAAEKFAGTTAYTRPITCHMVKGTNWSDTTFTEPRPHPVIASGAWQSPYGLRLQSTSDYWWMEKPNGVWQAPRPADSPLDLSKDIITLSLQNVIASPDLSGHGNLVFELNNSKGIYNVGAGLVPAKLNKRYELVLRLGYKTTAGDESVDAGTYWVDSWEHSSTPNQSLFTIHCLDARGLMDRWSARYQMRWNKDEVNPRSVWQILYQLLARVGIRLTNTPPKPQSSAISNFYPDFTVNPGTQGTQALKKLLSFVPDHLVLRGQEAFTKNPLADEESCYSYGTDHTILSGKYAHAVTPSRSRALGQAEDDSRIVQESFDWPLLQLAIDILEQDYDPNLQTVARTQERADALLREASLRAQRGNLVIPTNVGQELFDVVEVTDARCGITEQNYRVHAIRTDYDRRNALYRQRLTIGAP